MICWLSIGEGPFGGGGGGGALQTVCCWEVGRLRNKNLAGGFRRNDGLPPPPPPAPGRGCVELQILKKWKWPNWVDCCDETLHTYWYWQDVAQEIVKCHLDWLRRCRGSKSEKQWNWPYLLKILNILIKLCIDIAIDVSWTEGLPNVIYHQYRLCRDPNLKNKWIWPFKLLEYFDMQLSKFWKKSKTEKDITHFPI